MKLKDAWSCISLSLNQIEFVLAREYLCHVILEGEKAFERVFENYYIYLKKTRSKHISTVEFDILQGKVFITPGEVFETLVDIDKDFTMAKNPYIIMAKNTYETIAKGYIWNKGYKCNVTFRHRH